jgi:imidazolonepropionase-like amidohydrolase
VLQAIIDEAHRHRLIVSVHTGEARDVSEAMRAGADGIEHGSSRDLIEGETLQEMAKRGTWYVPTLSFLDGLIRVAEGGGWADDPFVQACVWPTVLESLRQSGSNSGELSRDRQRLGQWKKRLQIALSNVQRAARAGVPIALGTDAGNPGVFHGVAVHRELELLVGAGLSPMEAIVAATGNAARYLGVGGHLGTIAPGKKADVLIVEGNPLQDIRASRRIRAVIKDGHLLDRERLLQE